MVTKARPETNPPHIKLKKKKKLNRDLELIYDSKSNSIYNMKN